MIYIKDNNKRLKKSNGNYMWLYHLGHINKKRNKKMHEHRVCQKIKY